MNSKQKVLIIAGAVAILAGVVFWSVRARRTEKVEVEVGVVERQEMLIAKVSATGEIKPKEFVELQAEIAGVITHLYVKEGDAVNKGDLLLRIDPVQTEAETRAQEALLESALSESRSQQAQIALHETASQRDEANRRLIAAELSRARKLLELAENSFRRKQELFEDNLISRDDYELAKNQLITAETNVTTSEAQLAQAEAQLAVSRLNVQQAKEVYNSTLSRVAQQQAFLDRSRDLLSKTVIRSPLTGVITKMNVERGERAVPGTLNNPAATLMEIADLSVIEAEVEVDETDIIHVEMAQLAEVNVDALPDQPLRGSVTEVGNSAITLLGQTQQEARDFKVTIQLVDPPPALRPGLSCTAKITTAEKQDVLAVPIQALTVREFPVDSQGRLVRLPEENPSGLAAASADSDRAQLKEKEFQGVFLVQQGKAEFVEVKTGITGEVQVEVTAGLQEGLSIVTGSYRTLRTIKDGDSVKIAEKEKR